ncbi:hypothetical protein [Vibrio sp. 10N.239.312.D08]|uniref:hypothetical protein n=1 Tax=Vibrio sp. 10N.239.312.D08 TaxID=3229978 RepID=UPI00354C64C4
MKLIKVDIHMNKSSFFKYIALGPVTAVAYFYEMIYMPKIAAFLYRFACKYDYPPALFRYMQLEMYGEHPKPIPAREVVMLHQRALSSGYNESIKFQAFIDESLEPLNCTFESFIESQRALGQVTTKLLSPYGLVIKVTVHLAIVFLIYRLFVVIS